MSQPNLKAAEEIRYNESFGLQRDHLQLHAYSLLGLAFLCRSTTHPNPTTVDTSALAHFDFYGLQFSTITTTTTSLKFILQILIITTRP